MASLGGAVSNWWRVKATVYFLFGSLLLIFGVIMMITGFVLAFAPPTPPILDPGPALVVSTVCLLTGVLPGLVLIALAFRARAFRKQLEEFSGWVKAYRRIALTDLARKLGKNELETEKLVTSVVDKGLVRGFIDRTTNEFVLPEAIGQSMFVDKCPRCGGSVQRQFLVGETPLCPYCHSIIAPSAPTPMTMMPPPPPPPYR